MPVGQAVMATSRRGWVAVWGAVWVVTWVGTWAVTWAGTWAVTGVGVWAGAGSTTSDTRRTTSSADPALRSASVKVFFTSALASLVSSCRWVWSPPAGAAMR